MHIDLFDMAKHFLNRNKWVYFNQLKYDMFRYHKDANKIMYLNFIYIRFSLLYGKCIVMDVKYKNSVKDEDLSYICYQMRLTLFAEFFSKYYVKQLSKSNQITRCCFVFVSKSIDGTVLSFVLFKHGV